MRTAVIVPSPRPPSDTLPARIDVYEDGTKFSSEMFESNRAAAAFLSEAGWISDGNITWREPNFINPAWVAVPLLSPCGRVFACDYPDQDLRIHVYRMRWDEHFPFYAFHYAAAFSEFDPVLGFLSVPPLRVQGIGCWASEHTAYDMAKQFLREQVETHSRELFSAALDLYTFRNQGAQHGRDAPAG
jgi:hypothetical protein